MTLQKKDAVSSSAVFFKKVIKGSVFITLPVFFALDASNKFWGWIPAWSSVVFIIIFSILSVVSFLVLQRLYNRDKVLVFSSWISVLYLLFKTIKDWLVATAGLYWLSSYTFYIASLVFFTVLLIFALRELSVESASKFATYIGIVFFTLAMIECGKAGYNFIKTEKKPFKTEVVELANLSKKQYPDVYVLQMDEYAGLQTTGNTYGFDNSRFVSELTAKGFQVLQASNSNYNGTPFSVLSLLNMGYVKEVSRSEIASAIAYSKSTDAISRNYLMNFFRSNGYNIANHSFFEVEKTQSLDYLFLPVKKRLMLDKTLGSVLLNDLLCSVKSNYFHYLINDYPAKIDTYNQDVIRRVFETVKSNEGPVFMYAHLMMPHGPFLRDSSGQLRNIGEAYSESNKGQNMEAYFQYLKYCNRVVLKMTDSIRLKKPDAVIVVTSDHGLRNAKIETRRPSEFNNFLAIYSPGIAASKVPDSLCTVNVFRLLLNRHFDQHLPMLENKMINVNLALKE